MSLLVVKIQDDCAVSLVLNDFNLSVCFNSNLIKGFLQSSDTELFLCRSW